MAPSIFLTGATGYIAGDALYALHKAHPDWEYVALVRTQDKADLVKKAYPSARIVLGGLDDTAVIEDEASKADVVIHAADASDHEGAARAIAAGILAGHDKTRPGYWLHTGGTGILTFEDSKKGCPGTLSGKIYDDWDGVGELTSLPDDAFHRDVDKIVLRAGEEHGHAVKTALVCPPTIYGKGRGPVSGRSRQLYEMAKLVLTDKYIPIVGQGKSRWSHIHVGDLSDLFLKLAEAAVHNTHVNDPEVWGARGYYLAENGEHCFGEIADLVGSQAEALGFTGPLERRTLSREAAVEQAGFEAESWGMNSRCKAIRARKLLGWDPQWPQIEEEIPNALKSEYAVLHK